MRSTINVGMIIQYGYMQDIKAGVYRHFKGGFYLVLGLARHSETEEKFVVYVPFGPRKGPRMTVRPVEMFFGEVERDGKRRQRFVYSGAEMPEDFETT